MVPGGHFGSKQNKSISMAASVISERAGILDSLQLQLETNLETGLRRYDRARFRRMGGMRGETH